MLTYHPAGVLDEAASLHAIILQFLDDTETRIFDGPHANDLLLT
jgi:hypothetical protein